MRKLYLSNMNHTYVHYSSLYHQCILNGFNIEVYKMFTQYNGNSIYFHLQQEPVPLKQVELVLCL